jgi:molybdopterin-guanine dinucleotide biosynthesis protein A
VLAVDLPEMNAEFLQRLAAHCTENTGAIPRIGGQVEPLAAFYPKAAQPLAASRLEQRIFAAKDFAAGCVAAGLATFADLAPDDAHHFANWNSPADCRL